MIRACTFADVAHLSGPAAREGVTIDDCPRTEWFGYVAPDGRIVAAGGLKALDLPGMYLLRGAFTLPDFRGLGIGELLSVSRVARARDLGSVLLETHSNTLRTTCGMGG